jgi:hypothetical protein
VPVAAGHRSCRGNPLRRAARITFMPRITTILALGLIVLAPLLLAACGGGGGGY